MKRPYLVSLQAIKSDNQLSIRASVTDTYTPILKGSQASPDSGIKETSSPIQSIGLITSNEFRLKILGLCEKHVEIFIREYDSDSFGNFEIKIPSLINEQQICHIQVYEVSYYPGLQLLLGSFIPFVINNPKKIIISDFDKTLCDTKFSTAKEMFTSLRNPLHVFPTLAQSIDIFKNYTAQGFQPFILSASPHFYEKAIRDWLDNHQIYDGNIFLKDYRNFFSLKDGILSFKDLKNQGFYKLNQLINILLMTGIPNELVLMGDGFESDIFIYSTLAAVMQDNIDPWKVWNMVKTQEAFRLTNKQTSQFLSKFYQLGELKKQVPDFKMHIYIRCTDKDIDKLKNKNYKLNIVQKNKDKIQYYVA